MTKIDIISGFLGAGKTTLIKKLVGEAYAGEKVVLIENEFGEIGIDGGFMKDAGIEVTEMNSGCICCSLVGDFSEALKKVLKEYGPDRIVIEPSGVGKLSDVVRAVLPLESDSVRINSRTVVADATKCRIYMKNFGEFYDNQIENAGAIILSRTSTIAPEKLDTALSLIREHNGKAIVVTTPWDKLDGKKILEAMENGDHFAEELLSEEEICPECGHHHGEDEHHHDHDHHEHGPGCTCGCHDHDHHHDHHADEVFTSWGVEGPATYTKEEIENILEELDRESEYGFILRAKGMVPAGDGTWVYFDYVPGESNVREGQADVTGKICVIGSKLKEENLAKLFKK